VSMKRRKHQRGIELGTCLRTFVASSLLWLCLGDFNEVLQSDEHDGIGHHTLSQMHGSQDAVDVCNLIEPLKVTSRLGKRE
jgi:hypothetical protein